MEKKNALHLKPNYIGPTIYWHRASIMTYFPYKQKEWSNMQFPLICCKNPEAFSNAFLEHLKVLPAWGWEVAAFMGCEWRHQWQVTQREVTCLWSLRDSHLSDSDMGAVGSTQVGQNTYLKISNNSWLKPSEITYKEISFCKIKIFWSEHGPFIFPVCIYRTSGGSRDRIIWKQQTCLKFYSPPLCGQGTFAEKTAVYVQPLILSLITKEGHSRFCPPLKK